MNFVAAKVTSNVGRVIEDDVEHIVALRFSEDGTTLVGADSNGTLFVWGDDFTLRHRLECDLDIVHDCAFDGRRAVVVGAGDIEVWDVEAGERVRIIAKPAGHEVQAVTFVGDRVAAVGDAEILWLFGDETVALESFGGERNVSLAFDGTRLVCAAVRQGGSHVAYAALEGDHLVRVEGPKIAEPTDGMSAIATSPTGDLMAFTARDLTVFGFDGAFETNLSPEGNVVVRDATRGTVERPWSAPVFIDAQRVAVGVPGGEVAVIDVKARQRVASFVVHGGRDVTAAAFHRGHLVTAGQDYRVVVSELP
jgi:WD40 repeat protein